METLPLVGIVDDPEPWEEYPLASPEATLTVKEEWLWEQAYREEMPAGVMFFEQAEPLESVYYSYLYHWPSPSPDLSYDLEVLNKPLFDIDDDGWLYATTSTNRETYTRVYETHTVPTPPSEDGDPSSSHAMRDLIFPNEDDTRASTLPEKTVAERAWDWWEEPPYLSWTEEEPPEPPLVLLEDKPNASPRPRKKRLDREYMRAVEDWTPRMKREYLREQQRERRVALTLPYGPISNLERVMADEELGSVKQSHYDQFEGWERHYVHYYEYDYDYDYEPPKRYPSHDYDAESPERTPPRLGEPPYDDYGDEVPSRERTLEWF